MGVFLKIEILQNRGFCAFKPEQVLLASVASICKKQSDVVNLLLYKIIVCKSKAKLWYFFLVLQVNQSLDSLKSQCKNMNYVLYI